MSGWFALAAAEAAPMSMERWFAPAKIKQYPLTVGNANGIGNLRLPQLGTAEVGEEPDE